MVVAHDIGMDYKEMVNGKYKLVVEPVAYFTFKNVKYAMTATEAACYDKMLGGKLRAKMVSLTHKNLPLSLFLQRPDVGFPAFGGNPTAKQSNDTIIQQLGLGVVTFQESPPEPPEPETTDYVYRTDTDVITSFLVTGADDMLGDPWRIHINGQTYIKNIWCPADRDTYVWVKWHTPDTPQQVTIVVTTEFGFEKKRFQAEIVDLKENEPPDPKFEDASPGFQPEKPPEWVQPQTVSQTSWYDWIIVQSGEEAVWVQQNYSAALEVKYELTPADRVQTAFDLGYGNWEMKSGYGVQAKVEYRVATSGNVPLTDITPVQHGLAVFPDFQYKEYNRFLVPEGWKEGDLVKPDFGGALTFKPNRFSYYKDRVHFTPLWYPDNQDYTVPVAVFDCWTPGGELYVTAADAIAIQDTMYDDWYIRIVR